ncbi:TIGR01457 family HAD-type hydrolase [Enterococcus timonensis]|uniref:TIGR01457 family HAD-type hydrolase n=1 Tax=Enterococcus timonensis TaxID=1852364 RepID=UPI0008D9A29E|nr:TIGR01457 family HAD-type hydrolase [Enterococcus timonensis]
MKYLGYLIDLDGTIYLGKEKIPAGQRFISRLQAAGLPFLFLTNNTTKTPATVQQRLADEFDIHVDEKTIYTASLATVDYLIEDNGGKNVFVVGEAGLKSAITSAGFHLVDSDADYVVVALDNHLTYEQIVLATLNIQAGAKFIGTNPDKNIPTERGLLPGAGSVIAFVEASTQVTPVIIGKPEEIIMEKALHHLGLPKEEVLMVGDNYSTDIQGGLDFGMDTLLVTTGFTPPEAVANLPIAPNYVLASLDEWSLENE